MSLWVHTKCRQAERFHKCHGNFGEKAGFLLDERGSAGASLCSLV